MNFKLPSLKLSMPKFSFGTSWKNIFLPTFLDKTKVQTMLIITAIQVGLFITFSEMGTNSMIPKFSGVLQSMYNKVTEAGFLDDFVSTFGLILKSMSIAIAISLFFCYISLIPAFKGITTFISKLRFLTYTGLLFVFTILITNSHDIKMSLLLFGIIPYFVTSFLAYVRDIPRKEYELCYTLKFGRWRTLYEVIIKGKLHLVLEVIKQNFAICWMMITSVEAICMSEGGLGTIMIKSNKMMHIDDVFGILFLIFLIGMLFDYIFDLLKITLFPYTNTKRAAKLWYKRVFA